MQSLSRKRLDPVRHERGPDSNSFVEAAAGARVPPQLDTP